MTSTDILTRHAPDLPVDPEGLAEARRATFDNLHAPVTDLPARRTRPALRWGVAAASAAALTVAAVALPSLGDKPAFAGWTQVPTAADASALAANTDACVQLAAENPSMPTGTAHPVLSEMRGPWAFTVVDVDGVLLNCLAGTASSFATAFDEDGNAYGWVTGEQPRGDSDVSMVSIVPAGGLDDPEVGELTIGAGSSYGNEESGRWSAAVGRVGSDVGSVQVVFADGTTVAASTADGVFAAWWPSGETPASVTGVRGDGSTVTAVWSYSWPE